MSDVIRFLNPILSAIKLTPSVPYELEIRLGKYLKGFVPGINKKYFDRIFLSYKNWKKIKSTDHILDVDGFSYVRRETDGNVVFVVKDKINKFENKKENYRIDLSVENKKPPVEFQQKNVKLIRNKERYELLFKFWKLDLTYTNTFETLDSKPKESFEVEVELNVSKIKLATNTDVINELFHILKVINDISEKDVIEYYHNLVKSNRFIGNQPKTLNREHFPYLIKNSYSVTDKADGERMFLFIKDSETQFLVNKKLNTIPIKLQTGLKNTIIDGEFLPMSNKFFAFDILFHNGKDVRSNNLTKRYGILSNIRLPGTFFKVKKFYFDDIFNKSVELWKNKNKFQYNLDGLIFTPVNEPYNYKTNTYKWKDQVTLDVRFRNDEFFVRNKDKDVNLKNHTKFNLKHKIKAKNDSIIEIVYENDEWKLFKERTDKLQPNALLTALGVIKAIEQNITLEDFSKLDSENKGIMYNVHGKSLIQRTKELDINYRKFHNFVKYNIIKTQKNNDTLLDLATGKGGDLNKWIKAGFKNILAIDSSWVHIYGKNGFKSRINSTYMKKKLADNNVRVTYVWGDVTKNIISGEAGLNEEEQTKLKNYFKTNKGFDKITCNFALHYFLNSKSQFKGFMNNVNSLLNSDGSFVGTYLDGQKVEKFMDKDKKTLKIGNKIFYEISKYYGSNLKTYDLNCNEYWSKKLNERLIGVKVHSWESEIKESLLYRPYLEKLFNCEKLKVNYEYGFEIYFKNYKYKSELSSSEKIISFMHNTFSYKKLKN